MNVLEASPSNTRLEPLVRVTGLSKTFALHDSIALRILGRKPSFLRAVHCVNLDIYQGETLGLVGESGCGKTTLGRCILRLYEPDKGQVLFRGTNFLDVQGAALRKMRSMMQPIFQDPYSSLNPRLRVGQMLGEACVVHRVCSAKEVRSHVSQLLAMVGLGADVAERFPHELSGGQRQRVGLARALAVEPEFIVADEPVSSLDVSIQAQVINLLIELQEQLHLTMLFITHDLRLVHYVSHRVAVMYLGNIVELGPSEMVFAQPQHPYTQALLAALPNINPRHRSKAPAIGGEPPNPINVPSGCPFHPRCRRAIDICSLAEPEWEEIDDGRFATCHLLQR